MTLRYLRSHVRAKTLIVLTVVVVVLWLGMQLFYSEMTLDLFNSKTWKTTKTKQNIFDFDIKGQAYYSVLAFYAIQDTLIIPIDYHLKFLDRCIKRKKQNYNKLAKAPTTELSTPIKLSINSEISTENHI